MFSCGYVATFVFEKKMSTYPKREHSDCERASRPRKRKFFRGTPNKDNEKD